MPPQHKIARWPLLLITLLLGALYVAKLSNEDGESDGEEISATARAAELSEGSMSKRFFRRIFSPSAHRNLFSKPRVAKLKQTKLPWYVMIIRQ
jgi:hypothetical protein